MRATSDDALASDGDEDEDEDEDEKNARARALLARVSAHVKRSIRAILQGATLRAPRPLHTCNGKGTIYPPPMSKNPYTNNYDIRSLTICALHLQTRFYSL